MGNPTDAAVAKLEADWPAWQCWTVSTWDGHRRGTIWCARRWDDERRVLNASSAEELASDLAADAERGA
jgi:hypothetical protein